MSTVTCPNCKTQNTEGSRFCNRCGASLPRSTHITCPNCLSRNPRNLLYCDNCGTRLSVTGELTPDRGEEKEPAPSERPPRAFSLPTRDPGDELDPNRLLDWLRTGEEQPEGKVEPDKTAEQAAVLDDWLSELSDVESAGGESEDESSDWFQELAPSVKDDGTAGFTDWLLESESSLSEEGGLIDWLADLDTDDEDEEEFGLDFGDTLISPSPPPAAEVEEMPDWLSASAEETAAAEEEALPEWLSGSSGGGEVEKESAEAEALPDWLGGYDGGGGEERESAEAEALPDWLSETGGMEPAEAAEEERLPDWLNDFDMGEETPTLISSFEQPDKQETAALDWLDDFDEEDEAETPTFIGSFEYPDEEETAEDTAFDWLDDFDSEEGVISGGALEEPEGEDALLNWLSNFDPEEGETTVPGAAEAVLPDWLNAFDEGETETEAEVAWEAGDTEGLPDWLAEMPSDDTGFGTTLEGEEADTADILARFGTDNLAPVDELPDWLTDIAPAESLVSEEEAVEPAGEKLADWLSDIPEDDDIPEDTDWLTALTHDDVWPEIPEEEEIVSQLDELEEEDPDESAGHSKELKGVPKELASSGLPGWLQDDMPEFEYEAEEGEDLFGDGTLVQEALPDWLQQLKPADLEQAEQDSDLELDFSVSETRDEWQNILENMPASSPEAAPGAAALTAAEIPAWLQALRPRDFGEEAELLEADEPPETEGPLAGMRGVLPVAPAVVQPVATAAPVRYTISKEQQQQISLLHQLTHEEPAKTKQVSQRKAAAFSPFWRTILGLLLFLMVVAGVLLPDLGIGLPETALPVPQSALDTFRTIDAISGQTVLVAFEYTPAMAGELDPIALMLLRHLAENENSVLTISQSAAGRAIAQQITAEVSDLESSSFGLLTGEAVGLNSLGSCLNSADNCNMLLGSQPDAVLQGQLADIGLVIVLTSDRNSLVNWIEQVEAQDDVPVIAAVTQPLGPLTIPYLSSGQLEGSLNGIPAASAYEKRLRGQDGAAFEQFTAQTLVLWVVIVALVGAAIFYGLAGFAGRGQKKGSA